MKTIKPSTGKMRWPRHSVKSVEARKKDLILRISNHMKDRDEPGYDVEVYIGGVYDWNESECFTIHEYKIEAVAKREAILFAQRQIAQLL